MGEPTKRPLHIPPWQIPYLEKHRIFDLFHEIARELVIQQPDDHVLFIKQILYNAARSRNTARAIILGSPKINCVEVAKSISEITRQVVITENSLLAYQGKNDILNAEQKARYISHLVRKDNAYELGWILVGCVKDAKDAKALLQRGILPTHVIHLIPPFHPPLSELIYCHVPSDWPEYRRRIIEIRDVFKHVLKEVFIQQRSLPEIVAECIDLLSIKPSVCPIKPRIVIIGPRGSGRKTQAANLAANLNVVHVDFERLICEAWMAESALGQKLRECKSDVCFHSDLLSQVVSKRVLEEDCLDRGWVLTGFPYSRNDLECLDCIETPPNRVIFLECDLNVCKERLASRRINVHTGSITDIKEKPEAEKDKRLAQHPRDNDEFIDAELNYYCENYGELRKYCGGTAHCVNADQCERWVYETILAIITKAAPPYSPRMPHQETSTTTMSTTASDSCCCSPVPSQILDCYVTRV